MPLTSEIGRESEQEALQYLEKKGYQLIERNWSCAAGEIDLIMQQGSTRVFVEVRARSGSSYGAGLDTVGPQKQRKLILAAQWYQQEADWWGPCRFDVVSIDLSRAQAIEHIPNAFMS